MYCRIFSLVGFLVLLSQSLTLADEKAPRPLVPTIPVVKERIFPGLLLPTHDFLEVAAKECPCPGQEDAGQKEPGPLVTGKALTALASPPTLALPAPIQNIAGPWLPRLTVHDYPNAPTSVMPGALMQLPWQVLKDTSSPRVDKAWYSAPAGSLARKYDGLTVDSGTNLGLEVRAGSSKKDRTTNAIRGTASTQVSLLPAINLPQRFRRYLDILEAEGGRGTPSPGSLRMVLATNGAYALNPNTRALTSTGEVIGTLSWTNTMDERFTSDPWRVVAFRWQPSVSCEGRSLLSAEQNTATTRLPVTTLTGNLRGDLRLDFLSPQLVASGNYNYGQRLTVAPTTWEQASLSWKYQLNAQVSLGGSLTRGMTGPSQQAERELTLEMGVTF